MADYNFPPFLMKRVRYFNGQFLKDNEFVDDQKYHIDRRRRHERLLHVAGITEGLNVGAAPDGRSVTVNPGAALDSQGRQILLEKATQLTVPAGSTGTLFVEIAYRELESDPSDEKSTVRGNTRFVLDPLVTLKSQRTVDTVLLAELPINAATSTTGAPVVTSRVYSGVRLPQPVGSAELSLRARADGRGVALSGALSVAGLLEATSAAIAGDLSTRTITAAPGGGLTINSDTSVSGGMAVGRSLNVTGDVGLGGALVVARNITASSDVGITGALTVGRGLMVNAGGVTVTGVSTFRDSIRFAGSATRITGNSGFNILETHATDWLRINPDSQYPAIAMFRPVALGSGGLAVGEWSALPSGMLKVTSSVGIGVQPVVPLHIRGAAGMGIRLDNPTNGSNFFQIYYEGGNNTVVFYHNSGAGQFMRLDGAWQQNSDSSLKENVTDLRGVLDKVMMLRPVSFDWKSSATQSIGFIAQEVEPVFPELVSEHMPEEGKPLKGLPYATFSVLAVAAIKEMKNEYDARVRALEEQIAALSKTMQVTGNQG